jgi:hypothetical protein
MNLVIATQSSPLSAANSGSALHSASLPPEMGLNAAGSAADPLRVEARLGGSGGANNHGGEIQSQHSGDLVTDGRNTPALLLQSIGGGGGRTSISASSVSGVFGGASAILGGEGGQNNSGASVDHVQTGNIVTGGEQSFGVVSQSVGGGGGLIAFSNEAASSGVGALACRLFSR